LGDAVVVAQLTELFGGVLRAAVCVEHDPIDIAAASPDRHCQRVGNEFGAHVVCDGPADHPSGEQIDDSGEEQPVLARSQICDIAAPGQIWLSRVEATANKIRRGSRAAVNGRGADLATPCFAFPAVDGHDPSNTFRADSEALLR